MYTSGCLIMHLNSGSRLSHIAAIDLQITAGLNLPDMGNKAKRDTAQTTLCGLMKMAARFFYRFRLFDFLLMHDAEVMGRAGGFKLNGGIQALMIKPHERFFIVRGGDSLLG